MSNRREAAILNTKDACRCFMTIVVQPHTAHSRHARATTRANRKHWRRPGSTPHPAQQNARRCRPRVTRLKAATSEGMHETRSRLHFTSGRQTGRAIRVTCKRQLGRGMGCEYMHDRIGHVRRRCSGKGKTGDKSSDGLMGETVRGW